MKAAWIEATVLLAVAWALYLLATLALQWT